MSRTQRASRSFFSRSVKKGSRYWLEADESAAVTERLEKTCRGYRIRSAGILTLTNQLPMCFPTVPA
jgi:hypothetical protein